MTEQISQLPTARQIDRLLVELTAVFLGVLLGLSPIWYKETGQAGMVMLQFVFVHFLWAFFVSIFLYLTTGIMWRWRAFAVSLTVNGVFVGGYALLMTVAPIIPPRQPFVETLITMGFAGMWFTVFALGQFTIGERT